ncbi:kinesin-like protein kif2a-like protein [Lasius niger]|uniref:Kinesin-like protein kif2a-like protein n=1 Tax=Lasius niger TaxID=67767 RepID=A0A0J7K984_LASNI|nr:kinesin-like protein kif2a-like protein [Lasius niger]
MDFVELQLHDVVSEEEYTSKVSPADNIKAQNGTPDVVTLSCGSDSVSFRNETLGVETDIAASSTTSLTYLPTDIEENTTEASPHTDLDEKLVDNKRKAKNVSEAILEIQKIEEERKKRHMERMEAKEKLMEKLDKILDKL